MIRMRQSLRGFFGGTYRHAPQNDADRDLRRRGDPARRRGPRARRYASAHPAAGRRRREAVKPFVKVAAGKIALTHLRIIDGTGAPDQPDRTLLIDNGRIAGIEAGSAAVPDGYRILDATG